MLLSRVHFDDRIYDTIDEIFSEVADDISIRNYNCDQAQQYYL
jgi:hypothetical protein